MSGDHIVAVVAVMAMLILVIPGLARRGLPAVRVAKLALIWAVIFVAVTAAILMLRPGG